MVKRGDAVSGDSATCRQGIENSGVSGCIRRNWSEGMNSAFAAELGPAVCVGWMFVSTVALNILRIIRRWRNGVSVVALLVHVVRSSWMPLSVAVCIVDAASRCIAHAQVDSK